MDEQYLWDGTGEADPEIRRLEGLLAPYRYRAPRRRLWPYAAIAASVAVGALLLSHRPESPWSVALNSGHAETVREGRTIDTGAGTAILDASAIGRVTLESNSRLRVDRSHLTLSRGTLHASIWAPPSEFIVETPSARTIDLGCAYTLHVEDDGSGLLTVDHGWVAFQTGNLESFIPAGAMCRTHPRTGPGVPYFEDASERFRTAAAEFEATEGRDGLSDLLAAARPRDAITLWHLLLRTRDGERKSVAARFAELVPNMRPAPLVAGDRAALDAAWNALGLGETDWWRTWKRKW